MLVRSRKIAYRYAGMCIGCSVDYYGLFHVHGMPPGKVFPGGMCFCAIIVIRFREKGTANSEQRTGKQKTENHLVYELKKMFVCLVLKLLSED